MLTYTYSCRGQRHHGRRGGDPSSGGEKTGGEGWWRDEPELSWDIWHSGEPTNPLKTNEHAVMIGLPWGGIKPLHNLKSSRRQLHWKRSEWGHRNWNTSWCGRQWWTGGNAVYFWSLMMAFVLQVFFNEGSGRLECEDGGDPGTTTK